MNILINASNLHVGGGVQVASSFIYDLSLFKNTEFKFTVVVSDKVFSNIKNMGVDTSAFYRFEVKNQYGIKTFFKTLFTFKKNKFDVVFTIFGPNYDFSLSGFEITGFAQPWIIYPDNEVNKKLNLFEKHKVSIKTIVQGWFFKRSNLLIVELPHVKRRLDKLKIKPKESIVVVNNSYSPVFTNEKFFKIRRFHSNDRKFNVGFVGRDYPHKNLAVLPRVKEILEVKYNVPVQFYLTVSKKELQKRDKQFKDSVVSVGELVLTDCPSFYDEMDAIIFPSLLECFSATPLEAMVMKKPLFASNRSFVKDVCGNFAYYFEPTDPNSIAEVIANYYFSTYRKDMERLCAARDYALGFSSSNMRTDKYLDILKNAKSLNC